MSNDSWYRACRLADAENRLEKLKEQKVPEQILEAGQRLLESAQRKVDADPVATRLLPQARRATFVEGAKRDMFRISGIGKLDELVEILLLQHPDYPEGSRAPDPINWDSSIELFREGVLKGDSLMILMGLNGILSEIKYEETSL